MSLSSELPPSPLPAFMWLFFLSFPPSPLSPSLPFSLSPSLTFCCSPLLPSLLFSILTPLNVFFRYRCRQYSKASSTGASTPFRRSQLASSTGATRRNRCRNPRPQTPDSKRSAHRHVKRLRGLPAHWPSSALGLLTPSAPAAPRAASRRSSLSPSGLRWCVSLLSSLFSLFLLISSAGLSFCLALFLSLSPPARLSRRLGTSPLAFSLPNLLAPSLSSSRTALHLSYAHSPVRLFAPSREDLCHHPSSTPPQLPQTLSLERLVACPNGVSLLFSAPLKRPHRRRGRRGGRGRGDRW